MTYRITMAMLERKVMDLNIATNSPQKPYTKREDGKGFTANVGNYHISGAYGGWKVERMVNPGGGITNPSGLDTGFVSKRECYENLRAFMYGIVTGLAQAQSHAELCAHIDTEAGA